MTDTDKALVVRLRTIAREQDCIAAADRIEALSARVAELEGGMDEIAATEHADTCSHNLVKIMQCDCHVGIAQAALGQKVDGSS